MMRPARAMPLSTLVVAALAAGAAAVAWRFLTFSGFSNDHYVQVARGWQMLRGAWPVRDFVDPGMPLTYALSAAARMLFGPQIGSEFALTALGFGIGAGATAWAALRLTRPAALAVVAVAAEILIYPRTYSYPKMLVYGLACAAIAGLAAEPSRRRLVAAGVLIAAVFLLRHDHGLYVAAACAVAVAIASRAPRAALARVATMAGVALACVAPWAIAVQLHGGLVPYFETGLAFSRREADVSLLRAWPRFDVAGALTSPGNAAAWLYYLAYALPLVCVILAWRRAWRGTEGWRGEAAAVTALACLSLAVARGFLRDPLDARLPDVAVPLCLLGTWAMGAAWTRPSRSVAGAALAALLLVPTAAAAWRVGDVRSRLDDAGMLDGWNAVVSNAGDLAAELSQRQRDVERTPTRVSAVLVPFFHYVERCTVPSDRLLVTGAYADVFVAADRGFAGGLVSYQEGFFASEADQRLTLARLARERVPFAVRIGGAEAVFVRDFPLVAAWVDANFRPLVDVPVPGEEGIRIVVDRRLVPSGTDGATGWPCFRTAPPS